MAWHIDVIVLYDYIDGDVRNIEVLVAETWRVASMRRSSTTRNYIGAVQRLDDLRNEQGEFDTEAAFHEYWRTHPVRGRQAADGGEPLAFEPESVEPEDIPEVT
jgi:hypothetical protein